MIMTMRTITITIMVMTVILTVADGVDLVDTVAVHELVEGGVQRAEHLEEVLRPHLIIIIIIILIIIIVIITTYYYFYY